ncbi:MAG: hypothetical protein DRQ47_09735 [Gammaproteobacteria bacterium]|nr:MAG: hypothetical protein DRQ47_09735 [Gammaproteobacteria bacterium]
MTNKQISKKSVTEAAIFEDDMPGYLDRDSNRGSEGVTVDDVTIPRIGVLQDLSPQIKKQKPEYIEGAEAGQFFNNVTDELYGAEFIIVPVMFRKEYVIWKDRDSGGGFRGAYSTMAQAREAMVTLEDAALCDINDTGQHFVLVIKPDTTADVPHLEEAVISLSKGLMAASRQLNSLCKMAGGDRFSRAYKVAAIPIEGAKGDYWSFKFHPLGYVPENIFHVAEQMYEAVAAGKKDVQREEKVVDGETIEAEEF